MAIFKCDGAFMIPAKVKNREGQKGQLAIEAVLIVILLMSLSLFATKYMRDNNVLANMISGPWKVIAGMMATGNWTSEDEAYATGTHPHLNGMSRVGDR